MDQFHDKNLEFFQQNFEHREFRILVDLDSASKTGTPSPTTGHREFRFLADLDST